ncbi:hypothetical protein [Sulfitobacter sp. S190]|uniref:hypothetical protein n=1 Tax=Sulfitobacter sp. S190 TaxID=2867022 RepID=UPI0021A6FD9F|nr:hypothetical protein [Sulfitobacter sp. S190]UWR23621.1 hypothetical protein K3756_06530 [Sulfitobacter sp. S190]
MSAVVLALVAVLLGWMAVMAWCGYRRRWLLFLGVLLGGIAMNIVWIVLGLRADPFSNHAILAHASAVLYGLCSLTVGWILSRVIGSFRDSRVGPK